MVFGTGKELFLYVKYCQRSRALGSTITFLVTIPSSQYAEFNSNSQGRGSKMYAHLLSRGTNSIVDNVVV